MERSVGCAVYRQTSGQSGIFVDCDSRQRCLFVQAEYQQPVAYCLVLFFFFFFIGNCVERYAVVVFATMVRRSQTLGLVGIIPVAKDGTPNPNVGGTFLHCLFKVARHAHAEFQP